MDTTVDPVLETAQAVTIDGDKDEIYTTMPNGSALIFDPVIENNQSEPISGAWINSYDAYDELCVYPKLMRMSRAWEIILRTVRRHLQGSSFCTRLQSFFMVKEYGNTVGRVFPGSGWQWSVR